MKLIEQFTRDYKNEGRTEYNITLTPPDSDSAENVVCEWSIMRDREECTGTLAEVKGTGRMLAYPCAAEDDLDEILNDVFDGEQEKMDEALERAYNEAMARPAKTKEPIEPYFCAVEVGPWDAVEVHPCKEVGEGAVEQCEESEAEWWSVYLHLVSGGLECVADLPTKDAAQAVAALITNSATKFVSEEQAQMLAWNPEEDEEEEGILSPAVGGPYYVQEGFPAEEYHVPAFISEENGWVDESWHNDTCPKFHNDKLALCLWVGDKDKQDCSEIFSVQNIGGDGITDDNYILLTDSEEALREFISNRTIDKNKN